MSEERRLTLVRKPPGLEVRGANLRCSECGTTIDGPEGNPYPWCCARWWCSPLCYQRHVGRGHGFRLSMP